MFDNGATPVVEKRSRGLILDVDEQAMTSTLLHQYTHPKILAASQGSMQPLENGNVFVGWGEMPRVSEFRRSGHMVFDAVLGEKYESYRAFRLPWTGTPAQAPAIATARDRDRLTAYASWNGATGVHGWQLLAGTQANGLRPGDEHAFERVRERAAREGRTRPVRRGAGARSRRDAAGTVERWSRCRRISS